MATGNEKEKQQKKKITPEIADYIVSHCRLSISELAMRTGLDKQQLYYFTRKNQINVKKRETSVDKFLKTLA